MIVFSVKKKVWLEYNGKSIIGLGRYNLLIAINNSHSLKISAKVVGISEKTAHNYIKRIEQRLEKKIIESTKGGKNAGGSTNLTQLGLDLIKKYEVSI